MKTTSSWPMHSMPYHDKACKHSSYSRSFLFLGLSNTQTGCHFPSWLIPLLWSAGQGPIRSLCLPRWQWASQYPSILGQQLSEPKVLQRRRKTPSQAWRWGSSPLCKSSHQLFPAPCQPHSGTQLLPVSMDRVVVFPAPLCPNRTVICPSYMFTVRSLTASFILFPTLKTCRDHVNKSMLHSRQVLSDLPSPFHPAVKACDVQVVVALDYRPNLG